MIANWIDAAALERFADEKTDLHRVYSVPGTWIERCGRDLLFCVRYESEVRALRDDYAEWSKRTGFEATRLFAKVLRREPGADRYRLLEGNPAGALQTVCMERGLRYRIDFGAGYSNGFFIDQRENRRFLQELKPKTVLNLFAYTCSFSVAAAAEGAATTSVDVAKKALDWGRANFDLNGLSPQSNRFWPDDVRDVLRRQRQRGALFSAIVLDPPTFARTKEGKVFRVGDELAGLAAAAFPLLEPGGHLLLSTNCETLVPSDLLDCAAGAARTAGRKFEPVEIAAPEDIPFGQGATTLWVRAD